MKGRNVNCHLTYVLETEPDGARVKATFLSTRHIERGGFGRAVACNQGWGITSWES